MNWSNIPTENISRRLRGDGNEMLDEAAKRLDELTALRELLADQFEWAWETWMGWLDQPAYDFDGADKSIQHFDSWN